MYWYDKIRKKSINRINCWMCGNTGRTTFHHVIPKIFNPKENMLIPLCDNCHKIIHNQKTHPKGPKVLSNFSSECTSFNGDIRFPPIVSLYAKCKKLERINKVLSDSNFMLIREINFLRKSK